MRDLETGWRSPVRCPRVGALSKGSAQTHRARRSPRLKSQCESTHCPRGKRTSSGQKEPDVPKQAHVHARFLRQRTSSFVLTTSCLRLTMLDKTLATKAGKKEVGNAMIESTEIKVPTRKRPTNNLAAVASRNVKSSGECTTLACARPCSRTRRRRGLARWRSAEP